MQERSGALDVSERIQCGGDGASEPVQALRRFAQELCAYPHRRIDVRSIRNVHVEGAVPIEAPRSLEAPVEECSPSDEALLVGADSPAEPVDQAVHIPASVGTEVEKMQLLQGSQRLGGQACSCSEIPACSLWLEARGKSPRVSDRRIESIPQRPEALVDRALIADQIAYFELDVPALLEQDGEVRTCRLAGIRREERARELEGKRVSSQMRNKVVRSRPWVARGQPDEQRPIGSGWKESKAQVLEARPTQISDPGRHDCANVRTCGERMGSIVR